MSLFRVNESSDFDILVIDLLSLLFYFFCIDLFILLKVRPNLCPRGLPVVRWFHIPQSKYRFKSISNKIISQPWRSCNSSTSPPHLPFVYSNLLKCVWMVFGLPSLYGGTIRWLLSSRRHYRDCCVDTSVKRSRDAGLLKCTTLAMEYKPVPLESQRGAEIVCQTSRSKCVEQ